MQKSLRDTNERVFFDGKLVKSYFPHLKITVVRGTRTAWQYLWVHNELRRVYDGRVAMGEAVRPLASYSMLGANHFVSR